MQTVLLYRLTDSGLKAWMCQDSGLPMHYRQILSLIRAAALVEEICEAMRNHARKDVLRWLDELDTLCFVRTERVSISKAA